MPRQAVALVFTGTIGTDTTWTLDDSPVLAIGGISVGGGVTLTIEPGVEIRFISGSLTVSGELIAIGTPEQPIVFTSDAATPSASAWGGINFVGGGTVIDTNMDYVSGTILQHCEVRFSGGIALRSPTYIANCGIYDVAGVSGASGTSVAIYSDGVIVRDSLIIGGSTAQHNKGIWTESRRVHLVRYGQELCMGVRRLPRLA
ncbi:hypothetical protein CMK11_06870 [Candidatus Poribacteria bacterium]|nr:hypothetical protein [Candidatus Poribacteria bacterium]